MASQRLDAQSLAHRGGVAWAKQFALRLDPQGIDEKGRSLAAMRHFVDGLFDNLAYVQKLYESWESASGTQARDQMRQVLDSSQGLHDLISELIRELDEVGAAAYEAQNRLLLVDDEQLSYSRLIDQKNTAALMESADMLNGLADRYEAAAARINACVAGLDSLPLPAKTHAALAAALESAERQVPRAEPAQGATNLQSASAASAPAATRPHGSTTSSAGLASSGASQATNTVPGARVLPGMRFSAPRRADGPETSHRGAQQARRTGTPPRAVSGHELGLFDEYGFAHAPAPARADAQPVQHPWEREDRRGVVTQPSANPFGAGADAPVARRIVGPGSSSPSGPATPAVGGDERLLVAGDAAGREIISVFDYGAEGRS